MKSAVMKINFKDDTALVFGETIDLVVTKCDNYAVPLTAPYWIIHNRNSSKVNVTLLLQSNNDSVKMVRKLHHQFVHAACNKLMKLVSLAGQPMSPDSKLKEKTKSVPRNCPTSMIYKKE